jgi:LPXTG-motif cell wall-anchored protein
MIVLLILLVAGVLVAPAPPAWACSCAQVDALQFADVAFVGRVISIGTDADGGRRVEFAVESAQKGTVDSTVTLTTSGSSASCGFDFAVGHRYRVFARSGRTTLCSGNLELPGFGGALGDRVSLAPAITKPRPGVFSGPSSGSAAQWAPAGIGIVVLAGAAVLLLRRRRQPR